MTPFTRGTLFLIEVSLEAAETSRTLRYMVFGR